MQSAVVFYNGDQVASLKQTFDSLGLPTRGFTHPINMKSFAAWEKILMGTTAVAFLAGLLLIGVFVKDQNPQSFFIFRTVLALVGAAFAAVFIPGMLQIKAKFLKMTVAASGAAAFFWIIFTVNPPELISSKALHLPTGTNILGSER